MLERGLVLQMVRHHRVRRWRARVRSFLITALLIVIFVDILLAHEVLRAFVFVGSAILLPLAPKSKNRQIVESTRPHTETNLSVGQMPTRAMQLKERDHILTYVGIATKCLLNIPRGELVQLLVMAEDDDGNVNGAQHRQLVGLLKQAAFAFKESSALRRQFYRALQDGRHVQIRTYTERFRSSLMALISIFLRPILQTVSSHCACVGYGRRDN